MAAAAFQGRILLYTITGCPFCKRSKTILKAQEVPYVEVNLDKYPERRHEMQQRTGRRTVPQIFFNSVHIGGHEDLKKLAEESKLDDLLKEVAETPVPPDAPLPPEEEEPEDQSPDFDEDHLLPSQRSGGSYTDCTPDELMSLVQEIEEKTKLVKTHVHHLVSYKNTFVGQELVEWLVSSKGHTREQAIELGRELVRRHFVHHVTYEHDFEDTYLFYRFLKHVKTRALNGHLSHACLPRKASDIAEDLRKLILELHDEFLSPDGLAVDYQGISTSRKFEQYVRSTAELKRVDLVNLSRKEKLAFFINIYNALVIHAFVVRGPPTNMLTRLRFFFNTSYLIGGMTFSLNDIESGVLRANRKPIGSFRRPFSSSDPRLQVSLDTPEPRIHFALVCGAKSCPPIKTYSSENVEEELSVAAEAFLEESSGCSVDVEKKEVYVSSILKWYKSDFGQNYHEMLQWVADNLPDGEKKNNLQKLLETKTYSVKFISYNWDLNSS